MGVDAGTPVLFVSDAFNKAWRFLKYDWERMSHHSDMYNPDTATGWAMPDEEEEEECWECNGPLDEESPAYKDHDVCSKCVNEPFSDYMISGYRKPTHGEQLEMQIEGLQYSGHLQGRGQDGTYGGYPTPEAEYEAFYHANEGKVPTSPGPHITESEIAHGEQNGFPVENHASLEEPWGITKLPEPLHPEHNDARTYLNGEPRGWAHV